VDSYFGRDTPKLVLYVDGELVVRRRDWRYGQTVLWDQAYLTTGEVCRLLARLESTGFFNVEGGNNSFTMEEDPVYDLPEGLKFGEGGYYDIIQVNGTPSKQVDIYYELAPYVVDEVHTVMELLQQYRPAGLQPYQPQHVLLWIESGDVAWWLPPTPRATPWPWPTDYPSLVSGAGVKGSNKLLLSGSAATALLNIPTGAAVVNENGTLYSIIVRPLLPHEAPDVISPPPYRPTSYNLPFDCE
jgi:hypothetical protein